MAIGLRHMGKQTHTIAVLSSIMVHIDEAMSTVALKLAVSKGPVKNSLCVRPHFFSTLYIHVVSGLVDEKLSVLARSMLVIVTLHTCYISSWLVSRVKRVA